MRIAYINHGRFPTEKAHGFQIAQVCDALIALGHQVSVLSPCFRNAITAAPQQYYGLRHPLIIERLQHFDAFQSSFIPGFLGFAVSMWSYGRMLKTASLSSRFDLLYVRSPLLVSAAVSTGVPTILELHALPRFARGRFAAACRQCTRIVCLTSPMRDELLSWGIDPERVIVEADGVDPRRFADIPEPVSAKGRWKLPIDRTVVGYVGALATRETLEKGVRELITASASFDESLLLWVVGGPQKWIDAYQHHAASLSLSPNDVRFQGRIDAAAVPSAIAACDICVYPAPGSFANEPYFTRDTSPLKLFEYLAAGRPVVCADIPPVKDVVDERSVTFFRAGDSDDLTRAIKDVLDHPEEAKTRVEHGKRIVQEHSWEKRMERILSP